MALSELGECLLRLGGEHSEEQLVLQMLALLPLEDVHLCNAEMVSQSGFVDWSKQRRGNECEHPMNWTSSRKAATTAEPPPSSLPPSPPPSPATAAASAACSRASSLAALSSSSFRS